MLSYTMKGWMFGLRMIFGIIFAIWAPAASAAPMDGNFLYGMCGGDPGGGNFPLCVGYVTGVTEGVVAGAALAGAPTDISGDRQVLGYCLPDTGNNQQVVDVVFDFLEQNPSLRHHSARMLIVAALQQSFPCL